MHEAALRQGDTFPCCKQCGTRVRFEFVRKVKEEILPFRSGLILQECADSAKPE
jgi:hypothetical protein